MQNSAQIYPIISLAFAVLCILCPLRLIIQRFCIQDWDIEEANKRYSALVTSFPTDYDKENPLTKKEGEQRWLEIQIKQAEEAGDTTKVKFLKGEVDRVGSQTAFSGMQAYAQQNIARQAAIQAPTFAPAMVNPAQQAYLNQVAIQQQ